MTFALGCSFSFEDALLEAGLRLRFLERNTVAGVYVTNIATCAAGPFQGPLMVTMRAFKPTDAIRAIQITSRFPNVHGAPVHIGRPQDIGVDLGRVIRMSETARSPRANCLSSGLAASRRSSQ